MQNDKESTLTSAKNDTKDSDDTGSVISDTADHMVAGNTEEKKERTLTGSNVSDDATEDYSINSSTTSPDIEAGPQSYYINSGDMEESDGFGQDDFVDVTRTETHAIAQRRLSRMLTNADTIADQTRKDEEEGKPIPPMGGGKPMPEMLPSSDAYTVTFEGDDDPLHPFNWPVKKKIIQCIVIASDTFCIGIGSSIFASGTSQVMARFKIAEVVASLGTSLYVLGFACGPVIWAPLSELHGRRPILLLSCFLFGVFNFAVAVSDRLESVMICRFFAGALGSAPMVVVPASFADIFDNKSRGSAIILFSMAVFCGPLLAPVFGAFIVANPHMGWRWTEFMTGILAMVAWGFTVIYGSETHHPILLVDRAEEIRRRTGNWGIHASHEEFKLSLKEIAENNLTRPIRMLFTEPILFSLTIYNSFIYGMMYLFLTAYPIVFSEGYGMPAGVAELPYLALIIGELIGGAFCLQYEKTYNRKLDANKGKIVPEDRLPPMPYGAVAFPIGLLWFCWTGNYPEKIHWIVPTLSGLMTGFGLIVIFIPSINYIVDCYLVFAASAVAGNTFLRCSFGCAFPLFAEFMFNALGTNWSGLLLGLFSLLLIIFPVCFIKYGSKIRSKSKYAIQDD